MKIGDLKKLIADIDDDMEVVTMGADGSHIEYYPLNVANTIDVVCREEPHRFRFANDPVMRSMEFEGDGITKKVFLVDS